MRKLKVTEMGRMSVAEYQTSEKQPLVVVLDHVRSLYNVGSVFRSSDAFRIEHVFLCGITARPPKGGSGGLTTPQQLPACWRRPRSAHPQRE